MALTNSLSTDIHQVRMNGQSERIQFVPQMLSTLRRDIVFWSNLRAEFTGIFFKYPFGLNRLFQTL